MILILVKRDHIIMAKSILYTTIYTCKAKVNVDGNIFFIYLVVTKLISNDIL